MRWLSRLLDTCIVLPGGYRIGLDPIVGLIPGFGDFIGSLFSFWIIYDAARLGIAKRHLARMILNVLIETLAGSIPVLGDFFDAAWKANVKNMKIAELHYSAGTSPRPLSRMILFFFLIIAGCYTLIFVTLYLLIRLIFFK